jgi:hypothetical protein
MRHRAFRIGRGDTLESFARLGICHVMQEGNRPVELHLSRLRTADGEVNRAQGVVSMWLDLAFCHPGEGSNQGCEQTDCLGPRPGRRSKV